MYFLPIEHFDKKDEEEIISLIKDTNENQEIIQKNTDYSNPRKKLKKNNIINVVHNSFLDKIELFNEKNFTIIKQLMQDNVELKNYLIKTNQTNNVEDSLNNKIISMYIFMKQSNLNNDDNDK